MIRWYFITNIVVRFLYVYYGFSFNYLYNWDILCSVAGSKSPFKSPKLWGRGNPHNCSHCGYAGNPWSRPLCMFNATRSNPHCPTTCVSLVFSNKCLVICIKKKKCVLKDPYYVGYSFFHITMCIFRIN